MAWGNRKWAVAAAVTLAALVGTRSAAAAEITLVSCPKVDGGDLASRAFYLRDYPATNLGKVTIYLQTVGGMGYHLTLKATEDTFDGAVIGTASTDSDHPSFDPIVFDFKGAATHPGHVIAFALTSVADAGGSLYLDTGVGPCPSVEETEGVTPPLSADRRDSVGIVVTTYGPELHSVTPPNGPIAGGTSISVAGNFIGVDSTITLGGQAIGATIPDGGTGEGGAFTSVTPAHAQGPVDVVVAVKYSNDAGIDAGGSSTLTGGFTYTVAVPDDGGSSGGDGGSSGKDGGSSVGSDGGSDGNADTGDSDSGGCGCAIPGGAASSGSASVLVVALGFLARRRRTRRPK